MKENRSVVAWEWGKGEEEQESGIIKGQEETLS